MHELDSKISRSLTPKRNDVNRGNAKILRRFTVGKQVKSAWSNIRIKNKLKWKYKTKTDKLIESKNGGESIKSATEIK